MHFEYFIRICCFHPAFFCIFYETSQNSHEKYMYVTWLVKCDMNWENKQNNVGWLKSCNIAHCPTFTFVSLSLYFFFLLTPRLQITDWTDLRNSCPSFPCPVLHLSRPLGVCSWVHWHCFVISSCPTTCLCAWLTRLRTRKSYGSLSSTDHEAQKRDLSFKHHVVVRGMHATISHRFKPVLLDLFCRVIL